VYAIYLSPDPFSVMFSTLVPWPILLTDDPDEYESFLANVKRRFQQGDIDYFRTHTPCAHTCVGKEL
jgi:hypothetical protein